jgi:uncharacterized damage-inducible protein DinB
MNANHYRRLFEYNDWANRRVWECVTALTDEQFRRPSDYSIGSIHEQLAHQMGAEWLFLQRVQGISPTSMPQAEEYPTREAIRQHWDGITSDWLPFLTNLTDENLDSRITFTSFNGKTQRSMPLWEMLSQMLNHSTDHRAQTLALIHQVGGKTLEQDFIFYAWENPL